MLSRITAGTCTEADSEELPREEGGNPATSAALVVTRRQREAVLHTPSAHYDEGRMRRLAGTVFL